MNTTDTAQDSMTFAEALEILGISDYSERIFNSNSHGELMHLWDYMHLARVAQKWPAFKECFRGIFEHCVKFAEDNWKRPESVFQHMPQMVRDTLTLSDDEKKEQ